MTTNQHPNPRPGDATDNAVTAIVFVGLCGLVLAGMRGCDSNVSTSNPVTRPGGHGVIERACYVARSQEDLDDCVTLALADDSVGLAQGRMTGQWRVVEPGTRGTLIETSFSGVRVRFEDGRDGWLPMAFFVRR